MSRETLKSNALSCASLAAGVDASAALAGLKLQRMSGDQIKKLLQDAQQALLDGKTKDVVIKKEPHSSPVRKTSADGASHASAGDLDVGIADADTLKADSQEIADMLRESRTSTRAPTSATPTPTAVPSRATSPSRSQAAADDTELLRMALMKIQLLENEKAEAWGRHPSVPAAKSGASKTGTPGPEGPSLNEEKSGDEPDETNEKKDDPPIVHPDGQPVLGADALRMRLRRLCEKKASGKMWVDQQTFDDYKSGGERREWLELALCESLKKFGTGRDQYKKVKAEFVTRVVVVRERMSSKEQEVTGKWCTEEKLKSQYAPQAVRNIVAYCRKFPNALMRPWKYNSDVEEFFVEDETVVKLKKSDVTRRMETTDLDDITSATAPKGPETFDDASPEPTPEPEVLGENVVPDLERFMGSMNQKMATIYENIKVLENPANPPPMERYSLMVGDLKRIVGKLEVAFKSLAGYLTEIKISDLEKCPKDPKFAEFRTKIEAVKESVKGPCADWITVDASYKRVKKEITKALKKAEEEELKEPEPKKARHAGTHSKKRKGRAGTDAENTEDPAGASAAVPAKKKRRGKTSKK